MWKYLLLCIALTCCAFAHAGQENSASTNDATQPEWMGDEIFNLDSAALRFYIGNFNAPAQAQLMTPSNDISIGIGITIDSRAYPFAGIDFAGFYFKHEVDNTIPPPPIGTLNEDARIETGALMFGGRVFYPVKSNFRIYATGGLGYFQTKMRVYGSLFGFPGVYEQSRTTIAPYYGAGAGYSFGNWAISLDYRKFRQEENYIDFNVTDVDVGGQSITIGIGFNL